jgi:hypothetical protein
VADAGAARGGSSSLRAALSYAPDPARNLAGSADRSTRDKLTGAERARDERVEMSTMVARPSIQEGWNNQIRLAAVAGRLEALAPARRRYICHDCEVGFEATPEEADAERGKGHDVEVDDGNL